MTRWPVKSSNVAWIAYDDRTRQLYVQFKSGLYRYDAVPPNIPTAILTAESIGHFINTRVARVFPYTKIDRLIEPLQVGVFEAITVTDGGMCGSSR